MKMLGSVLAYGLLIGMASCSNPSQDRGSDGVDSLLADSVTRDTATWGDTTMGVDTSLKTDSLGSPSFP